MPVVAAAAAAAAAAEGHSVMAASARQITGPTAGRPCYFPSLTTTALSDDGAHTLTKFAKTPNCTKLFNAT